MPGLSEYGDIIRFQAEQLYRHGVKVVLGQSCQPHHLEDETLSVVVATGSTAQSPPEALKDVPTWFPTSAGWNDLVDKPHPSGIVVFDEDGGYYSYGPAFQLADAGWHVRIVTSRSELAGQLGHLAKIGCQRGLRRRGIEVTTGVRLSAASGGNLLLVDVFTKDVKVMAVPSHAVWAGPRAAADELWRDAHRPHILRPIGDAYAPRGIRAAIQEGHELGRRL